MDFMSFTIDTILLAILGGAFLYDRLFNLIFGQYGEKITFVRNERERVKFLRWAKHFPFFAALVSIQEEFMFRFPLLLLREHKVWQFVALIGFSTILFGYIHKNLPKLRPPKAFMFRILLSTYTKKQIREVSYESMVDAYHNLVEKKIAGNKKVRALGIQRAANAGLFGLIAGIGTIYYSTVLFGVLMHSVYYIFAYYGIEKLIINMYRKGTQK
jgi:hypothetical protein